MTALNFILLFAALAVSDAFLAGFRRMQYASSSSPLPQTEIPRSKSTAYSSPPESKDNTFSQTFVDQQNLILLDKMLNPPDGNLTAVANEWVNFCDENFDRFLNERISQLPTEREKQELGKIRYEINVARQNKLRNADLILRGILTSGGVPEMEAKLQYHLKRTEIDMPFMVILQLNIEDALEANHTVAVQVLTHLGRIVNEYQDENVSPPVRLLRMLVREDDKNVRKQMLRQKLLVGSNLINATGAEEEAEINPLRIEKPNAEAEAAGITGGAEGEAQPTVSPQCEHIVVAAVDKWGGADVQVEALEATIDDVLTQMLSFNSDDMTQSELSERCEELRTDLREVIAELSAPRVSDQCDEDDETGGNDSIQASSVPSNDDTNGSRVISL
jgi:hypothetical protein